MLIENEKNMFFDMANKMTSKKFDEIKDEETQSKLINCLYEAAPKILEQYPVKDEYFKYLQANFLFSESQNKEELIRKMENEKRNPQKKDCRYSMAFRSILFSLSQNRERINSENIASIRNDLKPFFDILQSN